MMRGARKCETCHWFQDRRDQWAAGCKLDICKCRREGKEFGIALCPNYKSQTFVDTSGERLSGPAAGTCNWMPPPLLMPWPYVQKLRATTDWCSLHTPVQATHDLYSDVRELISPSRRSLAAPALNPQQQEQK